MSDAGSIRMVSVRGGRVRPGVVLGLVGVMVLSLVAGSLGAVAASGAAGGLPPASAYPLAPAAAPPACPMVNTGYLWPQVSAAASVPDPTLACYLATPYASTAPTMLGPGGQTVMPGQTMTYSIAPGTGFSQAAWLLWWNNLYDPQPLMRSADGLPANDISGYDQFFAIPPALDDSGCRNPGSTDYDQGRYVASCAVKMSKGPYYGTPAGQHLPWTIFTASIFGAFGVTQHSPRVTNSGHAPLWSDYRSFVELPVFLQPSPYAGFSAVVSGGSVQLTDATKSDLQIVSTSWDFGDGHVVSQTNPSHTYTSTGTYTVTERVTTIDGQSDTSSQSIDVVASPVASIDLGVSIAPLNPALGQTVTATYTVSNTGGLDVNNIVVASSAAPAAVITTMSSVTPASGVAVVGGGAAFTQRFKYLGGSLATISASASGTANANTVSSPVRKRVFGVSGQLSVSWAVATPSVVLQPDAAGEPIPQLVAASVTVKNTGTGPVKNVQLPLPVLTTTASPVPMMYDAASPVPNPNIGTLAAGASATLAYTLQAQYQGLVTATATASGLVGSATVTAVKAQVLNVTENNPVTTTWAMDKRYDNPGDEATTAAEVNPGDWGFSATYKLNGACPTNTTAVWSVAGVTVATAPVKKCKMKFRRADVDPFKLQVVVKRGTSQVGRKVDPLTPRDILVASIGDSLSSGEGVQEASGWRNANCDRSSLAGSARAARQLEDADPHSSVTFVHLACSGATGAAGLLGPYSGMRSGWEPPQIAYLKTLTQQRGIDAVLMTIGINDSGFGKIATHCLSVTDCINQPINTDFAGQTVPQLLADRFSKLPQVYTDVAAELDLIGVQRSRVYLMEYPDPLHNDQGGPADYNGSPLPVHLEAQESAWLYPHFVVQLNKIGAASAAANGWTRVSGAQGTFRLHGLDDTTADRWFNTVGESIFNPGDANGSLHPNVTGHTIFGKIIYSSLKNTLTTPPAPAPTGP